MTSGPMAGGPVAVLVNPTAGRGRHRGTLPAVLERLSAAGRPIEPVAAASGAQAAKACQAAVDAGASAVVAVGGDGTVHLAVEAVLVAGANPPCYGGGCRAGPAAARTDGVLAIVVGGRFTGAGLVRILPHVRRGTHIGRPLVSDYRAGTVTLAAEGITAYADGERVAAPALTVNCVSAAVT